MERHSDDQTETSSSGSSISADEKRAERMKRLRELHLRRVKNKAHNESWWYLLVEKQSRLRMVWLKAILAFRNFD